MDELDKKIVEILKNDASTPLSRIADMIGVPRPTVYLRFNKMKEDGVIKGYNIVLGMQMDGPMKAAVITIKDYLLSDMGPRAVKNVGDKLSKRNDVYFAAKIGRSSIYVVWKDSDFNPKEYTEVLNIEYMKPEIFKSP